jgi:hypothetical protein
MRGSSFIYFKVPNFMVEAYESDRTHKFADHDYMQ